MAAAVNDRIYFNSAQFSLFASFCALNYKAALISHAFLKNTFLLFFYFVFGLGNDLPWNNFPQTISLDMGRESGMM